VFLRFHADMTERQIAQAVGISQAHVSRLLEGALTKLRAEMAAEDSAKGRGDTTPNRVISTVSDSKIGDVGADQEPTSAHRTKPKPTTSYSGKFLVRMPSELHEQLAHAAQQQDVSLNRFVTDALATSIGASSEPGSAEPRSGSRESGREQKPPASQRLSPSA